MLSTIVLWLLLLLPLAYSWIPQPSRTRFHPQRTATKSSSLLSSSQLPIEESVEEQVANAKASLQQILQRQKLELLETERLLEQVSNILPSQSTNASSLSTLPTLAQSVLAGVDYGFQSRSEGCRVDDFYRSNNSNANRLKELNYYGPPANIFTLSQQQFRRNFNAIRGEYSKSEALPKDLTPVQIQLQKELQSLTLNSTAIWERERARGPLVAPLIIKGPYYILCWLLDRVFEEAYVPSRFFLLETVARMPYFSYISMLQLYETLGFWRRSADVKRIHFAEEW